MAGVLLADAQNLSVLDPAGPPAESIRGLFVLVSAITFGIFLLVEGVLIYSLVTGRRRAGPTDPEPPQVYGSKPIEIAWTAGPALVVFVLILLVGRVIWEIQPNPDRPPPGAEPLRVTVVGHQWWWEYRYESYNGRELGFVTANELHIPTGEVGTPRPVYLTLQSADVCHSFWVPRLGGKTDLLPGRTNQMWIQTDEPGVYLGQCAEYCGTQHAHMLLRVVAEPPAAFEKWLAAEAAPAADDPAGRAGKAEFLSLSCVNCHTIRGTTARGTFGPDLTHLMARQTLAAGTTPNSPADLRRWVNNPQQAKPGCLMPAFALTDRNLTLAVDYLETLR
ncbi:MAG: cytochrome c oxidase subunit II [Gemmataceae bacterium]|nr:cytochrome c oxidase subunit II [Gemmataceae bacterium]